MVLRSLFYKQNLVFKTYPLFLKDNPLHLVRKIFYVRGRGLLLRIDDEISVPGSDLRAAHRKSLQAAFIDYLARDDSVSSVVFKCRA